MLQRYKLRLSDGTAFVVDRDGLNTWALDQRAMVQAIGSHEWFSLREFVAAERIAARRQAIRKTAEPPAESLPDAPTPPVTARAEPVEPAAPAPEPADPAPTSLSLAPSARQVEPAEEEPPEMSWADVEDELAPALAASEPPAFSASGPAPVAQDEAPGAAAGEDPACASEELPFVSGRLPVPSAEPEEEPPPPALPAADDEPPRWPSEWQEAASVSGPGLQTLADDVASASTGSGEAAGVHGEIAVIPFKPLDDGDVTAAAAVEDEVVPDPSRRHPADEVLFRALETYANVVTRVVRGLGRLPSLVGRRPGRARAERPSWREALRNRVSASKDAVARWADETGLRVRDEPASPPVPRPVEPVRPAEAVARGLVVTAPVATMPIAASPEPFLGRPRETAAAPTAVKDLPTLRLAEFRDEPPEDVYDGEDVYGEEGPAAVWVWFKRVVAAGLLVGLGLVAASSWRTWAPEALRLARQGASEVDAYRRSREEARIRERVGALAPQLPHLSAETIRTVLASRPASVLDPPEIFRIAYEAEDAGRARLGPAEAQELDGLRARLLAALDSTERERVREYDRVRGHRITFDFENASVLESFARGWGTLPPAARARLRFLGGKAVAAGLAPSGGPAPVATAAR